jgi:acetyltransferase
MSVRNLDKLFKPQSVALIGATPRPDAVGAVVARNLRTAGFGGEMMLVNPRHSTIDGLAVYPNVAGLPCAPDLAVIVTPPETVPSLIAELGRRGTRAAVVITAPSASSGSGAAACSKPHSTRPNPISCASSGPTASASWCPNSGSTPRSLIWPHR